ncbi:MAG: ankyrin repeat domain-containing protein [Endozoicomonadaceae bacterium]|nr:ankyrin repeat domain-containing protein [Endozoicomonadaceae bacterium]
MMNQLEIYIDEAETEDEKALYVMAMSEKDYRFCLTALLKAIKRDNMDMIKLIVENQHPRYNLDLSIREAIRCGKEDTLKYLLSRNKIKNEQLCGCVYKVLEVGSSAMLQSIIDSGFDVNACDKDVFVNELEKDNIEIAQQFIDAGLTVTDAPYTHLMKAFKVNPIHVNMILDTFNQSQVNQFITDADNGEVDIRGYVDVPDELLAMVKCRALEQAVTNITTEHRQVDDQQKKVITNSL